MLAGRSARNPNVRKVALLIETSNDYARGLLRGVVAYLREHRPWSLYLAEHGRGDTPPSWLANWDGDGIIARIENPAIARALRSVKVPVVDVSAARLIPSLPWVETDDAAIAQAAFEHLRERGFRNFAYCGDPRFNWSNWRGEHFARAVRVGGGTCLTYAASERSAGDDAREADDIARWLRRLPKPVGVMACYDLRGVQ
ncbi:MAG: substrate-binding domain-containing protein, partial [Verrucomicrobiae bacterium]|nr:substrate-binding domain-containing protein [Verrucomicrobiae bacterium]